MANEYYERLSEMNPGDLADGLAMEAEFDAISQGFSKLPTPHTGGQGFDGPVRVGDAQHPDEAVTKAQLDKALGKAKSLAIATYGDLNAEAWATLDSGTYLLFGTGAQLINFPAALVAGATYYVTVRHAVGDVGVSLYLDELAFASTDDAANVDLGRSMVRVGADLAAAISAGWKKAQPLDATLTALAGLTTAADKLAYFTGVDTAALATLTPFARSLLDDSDAATARATLGALGMSAMVITTEDWNTITAQGIYRVANATGSNRPDAYGFGVLVVTSNLTVVEQTYYPHYSGFGWRPASIVRRQSYSGGGFWEFQWDYIYGNLNIVGGVSQSAGVPTGAIIERGSNANGEYTKFADGTMICTSLKSFGSVNPAPGAFAILGIGGVTYWTWPSAFTSQNASYQLLTGNSYNFILGVENSSNAGCGSFHLRNLGTAVPTSPSVSCMAIGRWY